MGNDIEIEMGNLNDTDIEIEMGNDNDIEMGNDNDNDCCICINTTSGTWFKNNCCNQIIHKGCLLEWFCTSGEINCPYCRTSINLESLINKRDFLNFTSGKNFDHDKIEKILNAEYNAEYNDNVVIINNGNNTTVNINFESENRIVSIYSKCVYTIFTCLILFLIIQTTFASK